MKQEFLDDLDWLAFCYVADELESSERDEFEKRLAEDQQAREAVEKAVSLGQIVYATRGERNVRVANAAPACERLPTATRPVQVHVGVLLAASIVLTLFSAGWFWHTRTESNVDQIVASSVATDALVIAWADMLEQTDEDDLLNTDSDDVLFDDFDDQSVSWMADALEDASESKPNSTRDEQ